MKMGEEPKENNVGLGMDIKQIATAVARELKTLEKPEEKDKEKGTEEKFNCPDCGTELKAGVKYCPNCGVELLWED